MTGAEVKNRFLSEAEASSVKTASTRIADTVTFVEVEAESSERRAGSKGESWQKFDKSKWITFDTGCHIFVSKCVNRPC